MDIRALRYSGQGASSQSAPSHHSATRNARVLLPTIVVLTLILAPFSASAQGRTGIPRMGLLSFGSLLKDAGPGLERVSVLRASNESQRGASAEPLEAGAGRLGLELQVLNVRGRADFEGAFGRAREARSQALLVVATNLSVSNRSELARLALQSGLLTISDFPLMAHAGFLMSYGADLDDLGRRSISLVDKILRAWHRATCRPSDL